jgi:hypothetical protein
MLSPAGRTDTDLLHLGMAAIDFGGRDIVREVIQFFRNAAQHLLQVLLDSYVRQPPCVVSFRVIIE